MRNASILMVTVTAAALAQPPQGQRRSRSPAWSGSIARRFRMKC